MLPEQNASAALDDPKRAPVEKRRYADEVRFYRGLHLRFEESIPALAAQYDVPVIRLKSIKSDHAFELLRELELDDEIRNSFSRWLDVALAVAIKEYGDRI